MSLLDGRPPAAGFSPWGRVTLVYSTEVLVVHRGMVTKVRYRPSAHAADSVVSVAHVGEVDEMQIFMPPAVAEAYYASIVQEDGDVVWTRSDDGTWTCKRAPELSRT